MDGVSRVPSSCVHSLTECRYHVCHFLCRLRYLPYSDGAGPKYRHRDRGQIYRRLRRFDGELSHGLRQLPSFMLIVFAAQGSTLVGGTIADLFEASNRGESCASPAKVFPDHFASSRITDGPPVPFLQCRSKLTTCAQAIFSVCAFAGTGTSLCCPRRYPLLTSILRRSRSRSDGLRCSKPRLAMDPVPPDDPRWHPLHRAGGLHARDARRVVLASLRGRRSDPLGAQDRLFFLVEQRE